jgi:hypothetical protein
VITLITGQPGAGKTLFGIQFVRELAAREKRTVYYSGIKDLRLRAVAVPRQHALVRRAAEPEEAHRSFDDGVFADARVGRIRVLVRPIGGTRQRAFAANDDDIAQATHLRLRDLFGPGFQRVAGGNFTGGENELAAERTQAVKRLVEKLVIERHTGRLQIGGEDNTAEIRRQLRLPRVGVKNRETQAVEIGGDVRRPHDVEEQDGRQASALRRRTHAGNRAPMPLAPQPMSGALS